MGNVTNKALRDKAIKKIVDLCNAFEAMYGVKLVVREQTELANEIAVKKAIAELDGEQRAGDYTTIALYKLWGCGSKRQLDANNKYIEIRNYFDRKRRKEEDETGSTMVTDAELEAVLKEACGQYYQPREERYTYNIWLDGRKLTTEELKQWS